MGRILWLHPPEGLRFVRPGYAPAMRNSLLTSKTHVLVLFGLFFLMTTSSCASSPPPAEAPSKAPVPQQPSAASAAVGAPEEPAQPVADEWAEDGEAEALETSASDPGPENALQLCEAICHKMDTACTDRAADFCRASCGDYESAAHKCPVEVEAALGCQADADAVLLCSNIAAPICAPLYKRMQDCRAGTLAPQARNAGSEKEEPLPSGFALLSVPGLELEQLLPEGARVTTDATGLVHARSTGPGGVEYALVQLPDEARSPTDKSILRTATAFVGNACQPKLRLRGRFETQGVIHVRLDTVCEDGKQHHGILHFFDGHVLVAVATSDPGVGAPADELLEAFLFSFGRKDVPKGGSGENNE